MRSTSALTILFVQETDNSSGSRGRLIPRPALDPATLWRRHRLPLTRIDVYGDPVPGQRSPLPRRMCRPRFARVPTCKGDSASRPLHGSPLSRVRQASHLFRFEWVRAFRFVDSGEGRAYTPASTRPTTNEATRHGIRHADSERGDRPTGPDGFATRLTSASPATGSRPSAISKRRWPTGSSTHQGRSWRPASSTCTRTRTGLCWTTRAARARSHQGVTTEVVGNCGISPYPVGVMGREVVDKSHVSAVEWDWTDLDGWANRLEENGLSINVAPQVGHSALRFAVGLGRVPGAHAGRAGGDAEADGRVRRAGRVQHVHGAHHLAVDVRRHG